MNNPQTCLFITLSLTFALLPSVSCSKGEFKDVKAAPAFPFSGISKPTSRLLSGPSSHIVSNRGGLRRVAVFDPGEYGIDFWTTESVGNDIFRSQASATTSFAISSICPRHADQVFVAGYDEQTGDSVIEKWTYSPSLGGLSGSMYKASSTRGTSIPLHWPAVTVSGGGPFIPPMERAQPLPPTRVEIFRGTGFTGISSLSVDPEGRFLLVQDAGTGSIYQLIVGASPALLVDSSIFPQISSSLLRPPFQDGLDDRIYCFLAPESDQYAVLHDPNNDGIFDPVQFVSKETLDQVFPLEPYGTYQLMR